MITVNGSPRQVPERQSVAELLAELKLRSEQVAVEVNREVIPRVRHRQHLLADRDSVEIVTLVGGG